MSRAPLDVSGGAPASAEEFSLGRQVVGRSRLVEMLAPRLESQVGRPRHLTLEGLLVAFQINALRRHHRGHLVEAARTLNALSDEQRRRLGIVRWRSEEAYPRVEWLFAKLCGLLESAEAGFDAQWFANQLARAAIPKDLLTSPSVAVDGTDVETWGALQGKSYTIELDGEAAETQLVDDEPLPPKTKVRTAQVFGIGEDGRKRYTKDPDARAGHRSASASRSSGPYVGYELHLAVQTRDVRWTNYIDRTTLGPEVPNVVTTLSLAPAGSHRGKAIVGALIEASRHHHQLDEVVWDPGYSLCQPETTTHLLAQAGIEQTLQPVTHQRGIRPFSGDALLVDGQLYSRFLPAELRDLASPPRFATGAYRAAYEGHFNRRARWRLVRHARPDHDGVTRWKCPFCAGLLRTRAVPKTMRRSRQAPLVELPHGTKQCCRGILSAPPAELPLTQPIPFGTTAWRISMNRRQVAESVNAALKGAFCDLARGFFRVFGRTKITVLLGFTVAAFNLDRIRSFRAKRAADEQEPKHSSKRRLGTWRDLGVVIDQRASESGLDPP